MTPWNFKSAVIPVTGAAGGIGLTICKKLRAEGAMPLVLDLDQDRIDASVAELYPELGAKEAGRYGYKLDVSDSKAVDECFERIQADHGPITHLVANAGIVKPGSILDVTDENWQRMMDVNLNGVMYVCRAGGKQMAKERRGAIVTIASISGLRARRSRVAYMASKAGVVNLTRAMALDLGEFGVRVNSVAPGVINTAMQQANKVLNEQRAARTALLRLGEPEEIANVVLFLLSDLASYVAGEVIVVDGGLTANFS